MSSRILLIFCCVIIGAQALPALNLTPCKQEDSRCLSRNADQIYKLTIQGVPEWNIETLEPMYQKEIQGNLAVIKYTLYNSTFEGFANCHVADTRLDLKASKLSLDMDCPLFDVYGLYEVGGQILTMPIQGNGDYRLQCRKYLFTIDSDINVSQKKDSKMYVSFKRFKIDGDLRDGMTTYLGNLFNGKYPELAASVLKFLNANSKPVAKELQGPVFTVNVKRLIKNFNKCLKFIPLEEIVQI